MGVVVVGVKITAAAEDEGLVDGFLQAVVGVLGNAVFMAFAAIDAGGAEAVVVQQGGVIVVQCTAAAAFHLVGGGGGIVGAATSVTPPRAQRAACNPCFSARKVSPVATSA